MLNKKNNSGKIEWIEGIRAIACLSVFIGHFYSAFVVPGGGIRQCVVNTPFNMLFSGSTPVRSLFTLSGIVLSYKYFKYKEYDKILGDSAKRYFRLMIPVAGINFVVYFLMKFNLMYNVEAATISGSESFLGAFNLFIPSLKGVIKESLYSDFFNYSSGSGYVGPLWTMSYEMLGSLLVLSSISILRGSYLRYIYYLVAILLFQHSYYGYFIVGMLISDLMCDNRIRNFYNKNRYNKIIVWSLLFISAYFVAAVDNVDSTYYTYYLYSFMLIIFFVSLANVEKVNKILENRFLVNIGKYSFAIYCIHWPVIESFSSYIYIKLVHSGADKNHAAFFVFILTVPIVYILSILFTKTFIMGGVKMSNKICEYIEKC